MQPCFTCLTVTPIELAPQALAVATMRAGGVALLDREFCPDSHLDIAADNLRLVLKLSGERNQLGLRLRADQIASSGALLEGLGGRPHWLLLCAWQSQSLADAQALLPACRSRRLLLEITCADQAAALEPHDASINGLVVKGHESGGWVGEDSTFVLFQKLIQSQSRPIYVQGGIGLRTASACRAVGAAGVVLDDQLRLMPESFMPADWKAMLNNLGGQETCVLGERLGAGCRILLRPDLQAATALRRQLDELELEEVSDSTANQKAAKWQKQAQTQIGWGSPAQVAWPVGQAIGLAANYRNRCKTTGRLIQAFITGTLQQIETAQLLRPLGVGSALATSHGTRYPIVQGPMTRVSDTAAFAESVAKAGALPLLALALMPRTQVKQLLQETSELLGERCWGVGILGFVPAETREEQIEAILEVKPRFALIAGGRPDQANRFEAEGIAAYIHVPVPSLLRMFLAQGTRRFVFEGRECGGHIGPLTSFMLWEQMIETLLEEIPASKASDVHVLFAGGIHDARSAAMVSALASPLAERGIRIGVLMGTAYLFTEEAVTSGAIVRGFQQQAISCSRTINIETGPGHAIRCAANPFSDEFDLTRRQALKACNSPSEIKDKLERLTIGRLRIASKGVTRDKLGNLIAVTEMDQLNQGMFMMGQVATMASRVQSVEGLHKEVCEEGTRLLLAFEQPEKVKPGASKPSNIAIVGIGALLPRADYPHLFWENLLSKIDTITEIPADRWDWRLYYDGTAKARDRSSSKWGGFLDDVAFDPIRFGIPPSSLKSISCSQLLTLEAVRRALEDAGYESGSFDREHTSVILGSADGGGTLGNQYVTRTMIPLFIKSPPPDVWDRLPEWNEESFPGTLTNVAAGRVANRFDFGGSNFTVDAACASSLTAVDVAIKELESGNCNVAIAGGVDTAQSPFFYVAFSKTQALSPSGRAKTFDKQADGIVISEGVVVVILKRLADAERDGDRIYAVIKGVAGSSDGKALGLTAPRPLGQMRAFERAYRKAGFRPSTIAMYEAHGTGTVAGDAAELETIVSSLERDGAAIKSCAIGSAKTLIGHTKTTAGAVGLVKGALALYHKILPPHVGVENPLDAIARADSPVYLLKEARPWLAHADHPRRCGISAFGFGGTNSHAVLEEYTGECRERAPGAENWPFELVVFKDSDCAALGHKVRHLLEALEDGAEPSLRNLSYSYAVDADNNRGPCACLSVVIKDLDELKAACRLALPAIENSQSDRLPTHILLNLAITDSNQSLALVFPGQGSQYADMAREAALYFNEVREAIEFADHHLKSAYSKQLSQYIYPPASFSEADRKRSDELLTDTHVAQPAIGAVSVGFLELAIRLGLKPDAVCGHSYGEYVALHAAGVLTKEELLTFSEARGKIMASACEASGAMAVAQAAREDVEAIIGSLRGVVVANHNGPLQTVVSGGRAAVLEAADKLKANGISTRLLPVAGPFHSPLMASASASLSQALAVMKLASPAIAVYSNVTAKPYDSDEAQMRSQIAGHLLNPVEFVSEIMQMHEDGTRLFVELGPKSALTGLIDQILKSRPHLAVSFEGHGGGLRGLLIALATLAAHGADMTVQSLFKGREVHKLELRNLKESARKPVPASTAWLLNGNSIRRQDELVGHAGALPPFTRQTAMQSEKDQTQTTSSGSEARQESANLPSPPASPLASPLAQQPTLPPTAANTIVAAYEAYQETMRQFLALQEEALKQFLGAANSGQNVSDKAAIIPAYTPPVSLADVRPQDERSMDVATRVAVAIQEPVAADEPAYQDQAIPAQARESNLERDGLTQTLLHLVSERTGYPPDMLGLDLDLEAELGIDSIKRIEILDGLQKRLPRELVARMQEQIESFTRVKSLNALVDAVLRQADDIGIAAPPEPENEINQAASPAAAPHQTSLKSSVTRNAVPPEHQLADTSGAQSACPRFIVEGWEDPLPEIEILSASGLYLITEDRLSVCLHLSNELKERGAKPFIISEATLLSPDELEEVVVKVKQAFGPIRGIIHLAPLAKIAMPDEMTEWRKITQSHSKSLFQILRQCVGQMRGADEQQPSRVVAASLTGGCFGRNGVSGPGLPAGGSGYGLLKTVEAEWPELLCTAIDFDDSSTPAMMARQIATELLAPMGQFEIGYPGGKRTVFNTVSAPVTLTGRAPQLAPDSAWVMLATGGARGITAEIVRSIAVAGMKMIVVGRSSEPENESSSTATIKDVAHLRKVFLDKAKSSVALPVPAQIESRISALLRDREIRSNLLRLRQGGVEVEYRAVDVRDPSAFGSLIDEIYSRYGRLDAVIHGAGVIEDKLIIDKERSSFDRVFDTKVDSTFLLSRLLRPESLRLLVLFSSTAGRLGNRGQADYAAANEVMNRFAWRLREGWPFARVVAINWGPWESVGMASESVNRQFQERGIVPIQPPRGCSFFAQEIGYGSIEQAEVIAGIGPWSDERHSEPYRTNDLGSLLMQITDLGDDFWTM